MISKSLVHKMYIENNKLGRLKIGSNIQISPIIGFGNYTH